MHWVQVFCEQEKIELGTFLYTDICNYMTEEDTCPVDVRLKLERGTAVFRLEKLPLPVMLVAIHH